jgi:ribonuclease P protein subunit RPR2
MSIYSSDTPPRILLLDDDPAVCAAFSNTLRLCTTENPNPIASLVTIAHSLADALALIDGKSPRSSDQDSVDLYQSEILPWDIIIADMHFGSGPIDATASINPSGLSTGLDLLREIRGRGLPIGLILLTGRPTSEDFIGAIRGGVDDMLLKPVSNATLRESVTRCFSRLEESRSQVSQLHCFAGDLIHAHTRLADTAQHSARVENTVVEASLQALEVREPGSYMHSLRVQAYTVYFAHAVAYPEPLMLALERAAILHDIGKIGLADLLLFKSGAMSSTEHERTHMHTLLGEQILGRIPFLRSTALIVRHHHEQFNGSGYPDGLAGESIPLGSRIFALMDALDAMTNDRPYRPAFGFAHACSEIQICAGTQFDPRLCDQLARIHPSTWMDLRHNVEQHHLDRSATHPGALLQLAS